MEFPVEFVLKRGDPGYSDTWGVTTMKLGRVSFPPNPRHGGRRIRVFARLEEQQEVLESGNQGMSFSDKHPLVVPQDFTGDLEKSRILAVVNARLKELGLIPEKK